jgi:hypothetical protein
MVVVAQEAGVRVVVLDELSQHLLADLGGGGCRRLDQSFRDGCDQVARHGSLPRA